jgi:hypothetical protein
MICKSLHTGIVRSYCSIGINDLGQPQCFECRAFFTQAALKNALETRFGSAWNLELSKLKSLKKYIKQLKRKNKSKLMETIYSDYPPEP